MTDVGLDRVAAIVLSVVAGAAARTLFVAAAAGATLTLWHRVSAARRALIWTAVLYAALALPLLVTVVPTKVRVASSSVPMISTALARIATPAQALGERAQTLVVSSAASGSSSAASGAPTRLTWLRAIFFAYLTGALWLTGRVVRAWFLARRVRQGTPMASAAVVTILEVEARRMGLVDLPQVVEQPRIVVPMTSGVRRPVIALPADWREWPPDVMRAVLVHELAHVARRDALTQTLSRLNRALAWANPLSWWLHHQVASLAELVSDDAALDAGVDQARYAETLLMFARRLPAVAEGSGWAVAMARQGGIATERRIDRVLAWKPGRSNQARSVMRRLIVVGAGIFVLATACVRLDATRVVANLALAPLQVSRAAAPTGGVIVVPLAPVDHRISSSQRPGRRTPDAARATRPSPSDVAPAQQIMNEEAPRAAEEWTVRPAQQPARIVSGFGAGAYRPGGGAMNPVLVRPVNPDYTREALDHKVEGDVEVEAVILTDGTVGDVRVSRSLDARNGLDDAAIRAARQWTFKPAMLNGVAVPMLVTLQLQFRLAAAKLPARGDGDFSRQQAAQPLTDDFAQGAYWIGTQGLAPPVLAASVEPKYTSQAMRDKLQGDVVVELIVMPDGSVGRTRLAISLDPVDGLDDNALAAAQQYRFEPGLLNGQAVPVLVTISLNFRLH